MWECSKCGETIDDPLDACWNCGTSKSRVEDPTFRPADDPAWYQCMRCGKKGTWPEYDTLPTCEDCTRELTLEREETRQCPIDGAHLTKIVVQNVVLDKCPTCQGVWLDGGELDLIKQALEADAGRGKFTTGLMLGMLIG